MPDDERSRKRSVLNRKRRNVMKRAGMSPEKACKMLRHGTVHGKPLTSKQKGALGARCGDRGK